MALAIPAALLAYILFLSGWQLLNAISPDPDIGTFWENVRFAVHNWPATMCLVLPMALTSALVLQASGARSAAARA